MAGLLAVIVALCLCAPLYAHHIAHVDPFRKSRARLDGDHALHLFQWRGINVDHVERQVQDRDHGAAGRERPRQRFFWARDLLGDVSSCVPAAISEHDEK